MDRRVVSIIPYTGPHIHPGINGTRTLTNCARDFYLLADIDGHEYTLCDGDSVAYGYPFTSPYPHGHPSALRVPDTGPAPDAAGGEHKLADS